MNNEKKVKKIIKKEQDPRKIVFSSLEIIFESASGYKSHSGFGPSNNSDSLKNGLIDLIRILYVEDKEALREIVEKELERWSSSSF